MDSLLPTRSVIILWVKPFLPGISEKPDQRQGLRCRLRPLDPGRMRSCRLVEFLEPVAIVAEVRPAHAFQFPFATRFWMSGCCPALKHAKDMTRRAVPHAKRIRRQATCISLFLPGYSSLTSFGMCAIYKQLCPLVTGKREAAHRLSELAGFPPSPGNPETIPVQKSACGNSPLTIIQVPRATMQKLGAFSGLVPINAYRRCSRMVDSKEMVLGAAVSVLTISSSEGWFFVIQSSTST